MSRKMLGAGLALVVFAVLAGGRGSAQPQSGKAATKLQRLLSKFPLADVNRDAILTEREAEEYRRKRQADKAGGPATVPENPPVFRHTNQSTE